MHTTKYQFLLLTSLKWLSQLHYFCLNAAQTSQRFMDQVLHVYTQLTPTLMLSSLLFPTQSYTSRICKLFFYHLTMHGIVINPNKCLLGVTELNFLGHHIDRQSITPLPETVQAVRDFPLPQFQLELCQFIGLVNFYHRFLPHCATLMQPLHALLSSTKLKSQTITWTDSVLALIATKEALSPVVPRL